MLAPQDFGRKTNRYPHLAKHALLTGSTGPNFNNRVWAKLIDFALVHCVCALMHWIWAPSLLVIELLFWSQIDGFGRGQSPGKWLLGLHTIEMNRGRPIGGYSGLLRNMPFVLISVAFLWDSKLAYGLLVLGSLAILVETFFAYRLKTGLRVGDIISNSRVFDYKDEHTLFIERFLKDESY